MDRDGRLQAVPIAREEGQRPLGDDFSRVLEGVGPDLHVALERDAGEGLVEGDHRRVPPGEFGQPLCVLDDFDGEFRNRLARRRVALGVGRRQTALANPHVARLSKGFDPLERVEHREVGVALERLAGELLYLRDARAPRARIECLESTGGVVGDRALLEQSEDLPVDLAGAIGREEPAGIVVLEPDRAARDAGGPPLGDPRGSRDRFHVARSQRALGIVERG